MYPPKTGNAEVNAAFVSAAPFSIPHHTPVTTSVRPVSVQIMMVSIKVPVIEIRPCSAGHFVLAAAATIGAEPRPDSLENTPRATPFLIAIMTVAPRKPPVAAVVVKALSKIMETAAVLRSLDVPEKQVKVEAEVIAVNRSHSKELGIDWDFKALTGSGEYRRESWNEQRYVTDDAGNIKYDKNGNPRMRNIEHNGWNVKIPEGYAGISYGRSVAGHPYTAFFRANLNALVSTGKARILARPNVVTMNGREAEILIGNKIPVIVEHVDNGVRTTTTEYRDAGIKLTYTPRISADGEITANVNAEVSTPYLVPEMRAYRIITRQANTLVRLRSGDMLTIGGLIDKEENKTFRKVPILGDIPLLGKLFQSKSRSVEESEIVIIIKAEILDR